MHKPTICLDRLGGVPLVALATSFLTRVSNFEVVKPPRQETRCQKQGENRTLLVSGLWRLVSWDADA